MDVVEGANVDEEDAEVAVVVARDEDEEGVEVVDADAAEADFAEMFACCAVGAWLTSTTVEVVDEEEDDEDEEVEDGSSTDGTVSSIILRSQGRLMIKTRLGYTTNVQ